MGKLIFEGDDKVLNQIAKSSRLKAKKYNIKISLEIDKKQPKEIEVVNPKEVKANSKTAAKNSSEKRSGSNSKK